MPNIRIGEPPSSITGPLLDYLSRMAKAVNALPSQSMFSGLTPNSVVTGLAGDIAVNVGSASTDTRCWIKSGSAVTADQLNWHPLRIA